MNGFILWMLDRFAFAYRLLKIDYTQLRAIIAIKIKLDGRRQTIRMTKNKQERNNAFLFSLIMYFLFGIMIAMAIAAMPFIVGMIIFFSYIMMMIIITLITDFSTVLLDTSDNTIILPRPVDSRTFYAARFTHIFLYLGQLTLALSFFSFVAVALKYSFALVIPFFIATVFSVLIAVFLTNAIYLMIMRFANEEKLKTIINYFQIVMAVVFMGGYQIGARMISNANLNYENASFDIHWWTYLIPSLWMSSAMETLHTGMLDIPRVALFLLAVLFPFASIYITNTWLTPFFNRKIVAMGNSQPVAKVEDERKSKKNFWDTIGSMISTSTREQGAFSLTQKMLSRDNKIKLKIYPAFGYIFVFAFIFIFNGKQSLHSLWVNLPNTSYHILLIYLPFMIVQTAFNEIPFTDEFKSSWIYYSSPIERPGEILLGMIKAIFVKLFIPIFVVVTVPVLIIWGPGAIDDLAFGLINNFLILLLMVTFSTHRLPLSMAPNMRAQSGNFVKSILMLLATSIPGIGHYFLSKVPWTFLVAIPMQIGLIYFLYQEYKNTPWTAVKY